MRLSLKVGDTMYYSMVGFLTLPVLLIINYDVILKRGDNKVAVIYRRFLFCIIAYLITDILWGILDSLQLNTASFIDTEFYFVFMALGILFWTQYVNAYLNKDNLLQKILNYFGKLFFAAVTVMTLLNLFLPVLFYVDAEGNYRTYPGRYVILIVQMGILLLTSLYTFRIAARTKGAERIRHLAIGWFGIIMLSCIGCQLFFPLVPLYAIGYMLGCCLLRTFVVEGEREEYRKNIEISLIREQQQLKELNTARELAYTDALTGSKSKLAYIEKENEIDRAIADGSAGEIAVAVFDINDLKTINDTLGHDTGDQYIISAYRLICDIFKCSPVYRMGGDEFVTILEGQEYERRYALMDLFNHHVEECRYRGEPVIAIGIAEFKPEQDNSFQRIFQRADQRMYQRKSELKQVSDQS